MTNTYTAQSSGRFVYVVTWGTAHELEVRGVFASLEGAQASQSGGEWIEEEHEPGEWGMRLDTFTWAGIQRVELLP